MLKLACVVLLAVAATGAPADLLAGTELVLTFLVHRHGDRTPVESTVAFSNDPAKLIELTQPYGYGQLTTPGKRRAYQLGKSLRERYDGFIAPQFNRSEIYIRATDSTRTKMTILSALAAIYPPVQPVFDDLNWTPVPYTTIPPLYDFNLAFANCPVLIENDAALMTGPSEYITTTYADVLTLLSKHTGIDLFQTPVLVSSIYDEYVSQMSLGMPIDPEIQAVFSEVEAAAGAAWEVMYGGKDNVALEAGVLLNQFYQTASDIISGVDTPRVRILSAHDFNVFSFESVTKITNKPGAPKYASAYALELRKVVDTGKYVVAPVYLPSPGENFINLEVEGCGSVCDYDQFVDITSENALDEDTWRTKCGWTKDLVIDDSSFAAFVDTATGLTSTWEFPPLSILSKRAWEMGNTRMFQIYLMR